MDEYQFDKDEFKNYLRISFDEDDKTIEAYWYGAEEYICTRISKYATRERLAQYKMFPVAVKLLATHWYESKSAVLQSSTVKANSTEIPFGVESLIYGMQTRFFNDPKFSEYKNSDNADHNA